VSRAGAGEDAPAGQEAEIVQQRGEALGPPLAFVGLGLGDRLRHAPPAGADVGLACGTVARLPDMAGNVHAERIGRRHGVAVKAAS
jgi:hypothetical protein